MRSIPAAELLIGLAVQTVVTMAAFSVAAAGPAIAADLDVASERVGMFVSVVYGVGIGSAVLSPSFIHRYDAVRVSQFILGAGISMMAAASLGATLWALALAAVLLGAGYGATAPTSSHLLMKRTEPSMRNLVFSIRQIGVPLGGVVGGLIVPWLVLEVSWQAAIAVQILPAALLMVLLQVVRVRHDADRNPVHVIERDGLLAPLRLVQTLPGVRMLAVASFFFAGTQLCFVAYMSVHLTSRAGFGLVAAGQMLAVFQIAGVVSWPVWGAIADRWLSARVMLSGMGIVMAAMAVLAGSFSTGWPRFGILLVAIVAGATASGYTGIAFAEFARIGGDSRVAETTGLGASTQFLGVMILPTVFSVVVSMSGYGVAYNVVATFVAVSGVGLVAVERLGGRPERLPAL